MYKKLKTCLLFPRQISEYMDEPGKKTVGFFFFLLILLIIPSCISLIISTSPSTDVELSVIDTNKTISAEVIDGKLEVEKYTEIPQTLNCSILGSYSCTFIVNTTTLSKNDALSTITIQGNGLYLYFTEEGAQLGIRYQTNSTSTSYVSLFDYTYEEIELSNFNFNLAFKTSDTTAWDAQAETLVDCFYCKIKTVFLPIVLIASAVSQAEGLLFNCLFCTVLALIFLHSIGLKFGKIFKTSILCSLPYVLGQILYTFTSEYGIGFIFSIAGDLLTINYLYRALFVYRLAYGRSGENSDIDNTENNGNPEVKIMPGVYVHKENKKQDNVVDIDENNYHVDDDNTNVNNSNNNNDNSSYHSSYHNIYADRYDDEDDDNNQNNNIDNSEEKDKNDL